MNRPFIAPAMNDFNSRLMLSSGRTMDPLRPVAEDIDIEVIAHALSQLCRFGGHTLVFYSVAEHCVRVSNLCPENPLWGLLHDAPEAYLIDMPSPLKKSILCHGYRYIEQIYEVLIASKFNLPQEIPVEVKKADHILLATEARDLLKHGGANAVFSPEAPLRERIVPMHMNTAFTAFINRYRSLTKEGYAA